MPYAPRVHFDGDEALARAAAADHGVLATLNQTGVADLVPACFAIVDDWLAVPIDTVKPKGSTALGRIRNLERDPRATFLVEHWDVADWSRLWWVRLSLRRATPQDATLGALVAQLGERYPQYRALPFAGVICFRIERAGGWAASRAQAS